MNRVCNLLAILCKYLIINKIYTVCLRAVAAKKCRVRYSCFVAMLTSQSSISHHLSCTCRNNLTSLHTLNILLLNGRSSTEPLTQKERSLYLAFYKGCIIVVVRKVNNKHNMGESRSKGIMQNETYYTYLLGGEGD